MPKFHFRYTVDIRAVSCDEMYVTLESLCKEMHITDIMGIVAFIRDEIYHETGCHASVGIGIFWLVSKKVYFCLTVASCKWISKVFLA